VPSRPATRRLDRRENKILEDSPMPRRDRVFAASGMFVAAAAALLTAAPVVAQEKYPARPI
jgi:hypothetical protein